MDERILEALTVVLCLTSASAPASAHFTLGELDGTAARGIKDATDGPYAGKGGTHVPGPMGYVFPGAGL
jgi:hypothetical protein